MIDPPALDDVVLVALEQVLGPQRLLEVPEQARLFRRDVLRSVGVAQRHAQQLLDVLLAELGQRHRPVALADLVVFGPQCR